MTTTANSRTCAARIAQNFAVKRLEGCPGLEGPVRGHRPAQEL